MQLKRIAGTGAVFMLAAALASCNIGKAAEPTPDVGAIYTQAAQTMVAGLNSQQTQTAQAAPPTAAASPTALAVFSPLPTFPVGTGAAPFGTPFTFTTPFGTGTVVAGISPAPTARPAGTGVYSNPVGCDDAMLIGETDPLDKTVMKTGKVFDKGWSLQNTGTCTWGKGYVFVFKSGDNLHGDPVRPVQGSDDATPPGHSQAWVVHNLMAPFKPGEYKAVYQMQNADGVWFGSLAWVDIIVK